MKETELRWKGRIASLKIPGAIGIAGACIMLLVGVLGLNPIFKNASGSALPASFGTLALCIAVPMLLVSVVPFFFPSTVFGPCPVDTSAGPPPARSEVRATGRFDQLIQLEPTIRVGERTRTFANAAAKVIPLAENRLMIYIRHVAKARSKGGTADAAETNWGAFVDTKTVRAIEPGKIYGWRDRWAVRFRYTGSEKKEEETLLATFESAAAQVHFVNLLQKSGFALVAGKAAEQDR
jgi:hypothetical protein